MCLACASISVASCRSPAGTDHLKTRLGHAILLRHYPHRDQVNKKPFTLCQHVGLQLVKEVADFTSEAPDDKTVSIHVRLHVSMREDSYTVPQTTSEANLVHPLASELFKIHSSDSHVKHV